MCSPTARVCLCPVHGRTVCGACVHTAAKCGVRRSQAKKNTLPSHACTQNRYREVQGFRQCDGAAAAVSTTTARALLVLLSPAMPPPPHCTKGLSEEIFQLMNEPGEVLLRWCYSL
ncbi:hypothetical protein ACQJBY_066148 [Aegilops geniculata]